MAPPKKATTSSSTATSIAPTTATSTTTSVPAASSASTLATASVVASAPAASQVLVDSKKSKTADTVPSKTTASKKKIVAEVPSVVPEITHDSVVASENAHDDKIGENLISSVVEKVTALSGQVKEIQTVLKLLVKEHEKQQKIIEKVQKKRENARKSPSGFAKPNKISDELCDFIGVPHGTEKSRTEVTRFINAYVKEHNLNNPKNRRVIIPDAKLKSILNVKDGEEVTFFILQRLISHHFPLSISKMNANAAAAISTTVN
jgi:chromatin remodeling complex protein RSC6